MPSAQTKILTINLLGPAGSGKGTQADLLARKYKLAHFVPGQLLRNEIKKKSSLGRKIAPIVKKGRLIPDHFMQIIIKAFFSKLNPKQGLVIDGFPRRQSQKIMLDKILKSLKRKPIIFYLKVSPRVSLRRLSQRKICSRCGQPPIGPNFSVKACRHCHGKIITRLDDRPAIIKQRLRVDKKEVLPVVHSYRRQKLFFEINGEQTTPKVQQEIHQILKNMGF